MSGPSVSPRRRLLALLVAGLLWSGAGIAAQRQALDADADVERLGAQLAALDADPALAELAAVERYKAQQALVTLQATRSRDRAHALFVAEQRVQTAQIAAEAELARRKLAQLDREHDQILLAASRREAELARRQTERLQMQNLARAEEAERQRQAELLLRDDAYAQAEAATAEAAQARALAAARAREIALARQEAALASAAMPDEGDAGGAMPVLQRSDRGEVTTLAAAAFATGSATLTATARASVRKLAQYLQSHPGAVNIEAHTDSSGSDEANLRISQRRADAVRAALQEDGVAADRLHAEGYGEDRPLTADSTAAANRRVEIIIGN